MYLFDLPPKILPFLECSPFYHQYIPFLDVWKCCSYLVTE